MLWLLLQITLKWFMLRGLLSWAKPSMLFQVHSRLHLPGITCELFRSGTAMKMQVEYIVLIRLPKAYWCKYQECREACGGQGLKTENRIGNLKGEYDVQSTFEGDNNVLMQQVVPSILFCSNCNLFVITKCQQLKKFFSEKKNTKTVIWDVLCAQLVCLQYIVICPSNSKFVPFWNWLHTSYSLRLS